MGLLLQENIETFKKLKFLTFMSFMIILHLKDTLLPDCLLEFEKAKFVIPQIFHLGSLFIMHVSMSSRIK